MRLGLGSAGAGDPQQPCKVALDLQLELAEAFDGDEHNLVDQRADGVAGILSLGIHSDSPEQKLFVAGQPCSTLSALTEEIKHPRRVRKASLQGLREPPGLTAQSRLWFVAADRTFPTAASSQEQTLPGRGREVPRLTPSSGSEGPLLGRPHAH